MNELEEVRRQLKKAEDFIKALSRMSRLENCELTHSGGDVSLFQQSPYNGLIVTTCNLDGYRIEPLNKRTKISDAVKAINNIF